MPERTFLNLSKERQKEILDTCLKEFVLNDYRDVSLTRIIQNLGLAKGSFYRYFKSKKDLYAYLIEYCKQKTLQLFESIFSRPVDDLLDAWVQFYLACALEDNAYPILGHFAYRVSMDRNNVLLGDVSIRTFKKGMEVFGDIIREQQQKHKIRSDVDGDMLVFFLLQVQSGFLDYLTLKYHIDIKKNAEESIPLFPISEKKLEEELRRFATILRSGFSPNDLLGKGKGHD